MIGLCVALAASVSAQTKTPPAAKEIASGSSEVARLLREWYKEGTAAGNIGDYYDNRDGGHSRLPMRLFPQLSAIEVTEAEKAAAARRHTRAHWGLLLGRLYPHVTFGNSSTSGAPPVGCSNPRYCIFSTRATAFHYMQYVRSHLYIFPEHRDHDPGHNGRGGWGDLYHANIPYLIISQGSSGSDQTFMKAVGYTLAAFRPEVKKLLVRRGLLMPTVQVIFRRSNRKVKTDADYLTGVAHPTVFVGGDVDAVAMVKMAHAMQADIVPPMIQLRVVEEDDAVLGRDYFEAAPREKVFDTPAAIARIGRSTKHVRRMVVRATKSFDATGRPLTYHWVVLRGGAERIRINPRNKDRSEVELLIPFHERYSVPGNPRMETNRVDIGAFVHNGKYPSAPGFVSVYFLDDEGRTYADDGRILEVAYGFGGTRIGYGDYAPRGYDITDWKALVAIVLDAKGGFPSTLLRKRLGAAGLKALGEINTEFVAALTPTDAQKKDVDEAETAWQKARKDAEKAKKAVADAGDKADRALKSAVTRAERKVRRTKSALDKRRRSVKDAPGRVLKRSSAALGNRSAVLAIEDALNAVKNDVRFCITNAKALDALEKASKDAVAKKTSADARKEVATRFVKKGLTTWARNRIEQLNIAVLQSVVYPKILNWRHRRNFVDPRVASQKDWRDVYHYDKAKRLIGWTRHHADKTEEFTAEGARVEKTDARGRALLARTVKYVGVAQRRRPTLLKTEPGDTMVHYVYDGDDDRVGRVDRMEEVLLSGPIVIQKLQNSNP